MPSNLKLKNRILLGYAIPVAIYLSFAGVVYSTANEVDRAFKEVKRVEQATRAASDTALSVEGMIRTTRGYLINGDLTALESYKQEKQQFQTAISATQKLVINPEQKQRLERLEELVQEYDTFSDRIKDLKRQNKEAEMQALFAGGTGGRIIDEVSRLYDEFAETEQRLLDQRSSQAQKNLQAVLTALIVGSLLIVALSIVVALVISSGIAQMIHESVRAIANASSEIAATVEQHEQAAIQQSVSVNQTTTTMDELSASSHQSAEQAELAANRAQRVLTLVDSQRSQAQIDHRSSLREKVGQIAEQILRLSEQTSQIGTISSLVSDLANQTNMLALNAAVEAVRAGEHGKGFGVVAAEVRKLADQSRKSAERINSLVADIQHATNSTVMVTDEGIKTVESIVLEINDIALSNQQILLTAKQQAIAVQQVVGAMNAINQGSVETAAGISQTKIGTQKLNEAALNLESVI